MLLWRVQVVFLLSIGRSRWQECSCLAGTHIYLQVLLVTLFNLPFFRRHELHKYSFATIVQKNIVCHIFNRQVFPSCCTCITVISVFCISNHWHTRIKRTACASSKCINKWSPASFCFPSLSPLCDTVDATFCICVLVSHSETRCTGDKVNAEREQGNPF